VWFTSDCLIVGLTILIIYMRMTILHLHSALTKCGFILQLLIDQLTVTNASVKLWIVVTIIPHSICYPLCYIFDSSCKSHCLPSQSLQAFVTPVFKKGTTSDPANYRHISLTCTCCHIMERTYYLIDYLLRKKLISKHQHGFLVRHSTCTNLLETVSDSTIALLNHLKTDVICIDFQKVFEEICFLGLLLFWTIDHNRLSSTTVYLIVFT